MTSPKRALRQAMLARRETLGAIDSEHLSGLIVARLQSIPELRSARVIMGYLPTRGEVDLAELYDDFQRRGVVLVLPKVTSRRERTMEGVMVPVPWRRHVLPGEYGIWEPIGDHYVDPAIIEAVLVPGVAFDKECFRLGFGGGFYDRFLPRLAPIAWTCGVAYELQVVDKVPREAHDVALHALCTEEHSLHARKI